MTELPLDVNDEDADEDVPAVAARLTELNKLAFLELILLLPLLLCRYLDMTIGSALCPLSVYRRGQICCCVCGHQDHDSTALCVLRLIS